MPLEVVREEDAHELRERFADIHGHDPEATDEEIASWVRSKFDDRIDDMQARLHNWTFNLRFVDGEQWLIPTEVGLGWHETPTPDDEIRVTNNLTRGAVEYRVAKLTESRPAPKVFPHSNEVADRDRAESAQQLVSHLDRVLDLPERRDEALWYDAACGCAFVHIGWESETGKHIARKQASVEMDPQTGEPIVVENFVDANGEVVDGEEDADFFRAGEVHLSIVPPWGVFLADPEETDFRRQPWVLLATIENRNEVRTRFGAVADDIGGGDDTGPFTYYQDIVSSLSRGSPYAETSRRLPRMHTPGERVLLFRYYERPNDDFPSGRHFIVAGSKLLHEGPLPFGERTFPLEQLRTRHRVRDAYGKPFVEDLVGPQKRINRLESHAIQYIALYANGGLAAENGSFVEDSWVEGFGRILYYEGRQPSPLAWPNMPSDVWNALERAYESFDRIAGYSDVARGSVPPGVKAARAILELKRSNDTPLGKALQRFDRFIEATTHHLIRRAKWGYTLPHVIEVMGHDAPHLTKSMVDDDLPTEFSVRIETDSMLRLSYPAKLEMMFELADRQWIDPTEAKRMLNFGDWEHQSGQWNRDYARARQKLEMLEAGQPVEVFWWEDDMVHMQCIEERLKDPRYEMSDPEFKANLNGLWMAHFNQFRMKQAGELPPALQAAMQQFGAPPQATGDLGAQPEGGVPQAPPGEPLPGGRPGAEFPSMDLTEGSNSYRPMRNMNATMAGQGF